ncbi:MAG: hypothetical protein R3C14_26985 [Caldilineaceae bacterium]
MGNLDFFGETAGLTQVTVGDITYCVGDPVRLRPKAGADVMDLVLAGRTGVIEAVEQDFEERIYLAIVLDDDPGKELGMLRQPGHRFFYAPDEVEVLGEPA